MDLDSVKEKFNYELWRKIKIYGFTIECCNLARMTYGTGMAGDNKMSEEEINTELFLGDEIDIQTILSPFQPKDNKTTIKEFFVALSPKNGTNIYSLVSESLLIELIAIFEDFIQNTLKHLLHKKPELALSKDKQINASDLLNFKNIDELKEKLINEKIHKMMYRRLKSIVDFIERGYGTKFDLGDDLFTQLYEFKEKRNLIIHNRGIVNEIFLSSLQKFGSKNDYSIGNKIRIETQEMITLGKILKSIANEIYSKLTGKPPKELEVDPINIKGDNIIKSYYKKIKDNKDQVDTDVEDVLKILASKEPYKKEFRMGRNNPCYCGSGLKYKKCCMNKKL